MRASGMMRDPELMKQWQASPEIQALAKTMRAFQCSILDGTVSVDAIPAGNYELEVMAVTSERVQTNPPTTFANASITVTVPDEPHTGTLALAERTMRKFG